MGEHNFKPAVVDEIARRAMHFCSNPTCLRFSAYATSEGKPRQVAEGAHILPSGKKGPRSNEVGSYPDLDLASADNGIWLCVTCHTKIDNDPAEYPTSELFKWKKAHEALIRRLAGKDLESAILELGNAKQYHQNTREFLSFLEGRRALYEGLDHEFPPRVLDSITMIRATIVSTRASVPNDSVLAKCLKVLQKRVDDFLKVMGETDLRALKCDGGDPTWLFFSEELMKFRHEIKLIARVLASHSGYQLNFVY